jgi:hypothetical protein
MNNSSKVSDKSEDKNVKKDPETKKQNRAGRISNKKKKPPPPMPPNNANLNFSVLSLKVKASVDGTLLSDLPPVDKRKIRSLLPNFKWSNTDLPKDRKLRTIAQKITPVQNQNLCGCCWAMAFATALSDNYVVQGVTKYNPNLSTTYILTETLKASSGLSQAETDQWLGSVGNGCNGGNPAKLSEFIKNFQVASNNCVDFSWCAEDDDCNGTNNPTNISDLNTILPENGCFVENKKRLGYQLERAWQQDVSDYEQFEEDGKLVKLDQDKALEELGVSMKLRILDYGPLIGGFLVFTNLQSGDFAKCEATKGIYCERGMYNPDGTVTWVAQDWETRSQGSALDRGLCDSATEPCLSGGHAVVIVGWGIEKDVSVVTADNPTTVPEVMDVEYWWVRNSWSENWADQGYFKMARYPINFYSQFDFAIPTGTDGEKLGGLITFNVNSENIGLLKPQPSAVNLQTMKPSLTSSDGDSKEIPALGIPPKTLQSNAYYSATNTETENVDTDTDIDNTDSNTNTDTDSNTNIDSNTNTNTDTDADNTDTDEPDYDGSGPVGPDPQSGPSSSDKSRRFPKWVMWLLIGLAIAGLIIGLAVGLRRRKK